MTEEISIETSKYDDFIDYCIRILSPGKIEAIMDKFMERVIGLSMLMDSGIYIYNHNDKNSLELRVTGQGMGEFFSDETQSLVYCEHCDVVYSQYEKHWTKDCVHILEAQHCCACGKTWISKETNDDGKTYIVDTDTHECVREDEDVVQEHHQNYSQDDDENHCMQWFKQTSKKIVGRADKFLCELSYLDNLDANESYRLRLHDRPTLVQFGNNTMTIHTCCEKCEKVYTSHLETKDYSEKNGHCCKCGNVWTMYRRKCICPATLQYEYEKCPQRCPNCYDE